MKRAALVSTPLLAGLAWSGALIADPAGWDDGAILLIGLGLLSSITVAITGMLLSGGRWARRTAIVCLAGCLIIALARPIDQWWVAAIALTGAALAALLSPPVIALIRKLPSATGPPDRAVLLIITLLLAPLAVGLGSWHGTNPATLTVGLSAPLAAVWFSKVLPGGLYVARYGWPGMALALSWLQPWRGGVVSAALAALVLLISRDDSVNVAFYPPVETGSTYAIPPELAPQEVLDAADIDERGLPR